MNLNKYKKANRKMINNGRKRVVVFKSNTAIYAQIIDDYQGKTLVSANSLKVEGPYTIETARQVGILLGKEAIKHQVGSVYFDRSVYPYKGKVKALAEGLREQGLKF